MKSITSLFLLLICTACVSVPKEAPELSMALGKEIQQLEYAHLQLVNRFFDQEREKVHDFIYEEWLPRYATNFFEDPAIQSVWQQVVDSGSSEDQLNFILKTTPQLHLEVEQKYQESIQPLQQLENALTRAVTQKYDRAKSINHSLTAYLSTTAEVDENRQRYLNMVGVSQDDTSRIIDETEALTREMLTRAETVKDLENELQDYIKRLKSLLETL